MTASAFEYLTGFGSHFATEAVPGALPQGRNSPQRPAFGLYTEQLSGSAFTAPRHENRRSWLYRLRPTADHRPFTAYVARPCSRQRPARRRLRPTGCAGTPPADLPPDADFVDGLATMLHAGEPHALEGVAIHLYRASRSMERRVFVCADGELLIVPQQGALQIDSELGRVSVAPWLRRADSPRPEVPGRPARR
jgi:homogentisate 1,2-dioxygenase